MDQDRIIERDGRRFVKFASNSHGCISIPMESRVDQSASNGQTEPTPRLKKTSLHHLLEQATHESRGLKNTKESNLEFRPGSTFLTSGLPITLSCRRRR